MDQPAPNPTIPPSPRRYRAAAMLAALALLLAAGVLAFLAGVRPGGRANPAGAPGDVPDPRLAYAGPFRNVRPEVGAVAEERCADCHIAQALAFAEHPMGLTLRRAADAPSPPGDPAHHSPFDALDSRFRVEDHPPRHHRGPAHADGVAPDGPADGGRPPGQAAPGQTWDVAYVIGSGRLGHSYLADRDGFLFQTPVSWFSQKDRWDLSPGFKATMLAGRPVAPDCLFCHANRARPVEGTANRYHVPVFDGHAIGCQRCHGPGSAHVAARERFDPVAGGVDVTIVNPRHLEPPLREAVCEQCHLEGQARVLPRGRDLHDFRPGLPLAPFWAVFVTPPSASGEPGDDTRAVSHVEQMHASRCFREAAGPGRMGCTSCHDPHEHVPPARRVEHYRARCLACHESRGCSLPLARRTPLAPGDSCIDCHMPRYDTSDIAHTASTDHRVPRLGKAAPPGGPGHGPAGQPAREPAGDELVVPFRRAWGAADARAPADPGAAADPAEAARDLGLALVTLVQKGHPDAVRALRRAVPGLEAAARRHPDDLPAASGHATALGMLGRADQALAAYEAILARVPDREADLAGAAVTAEQLGRIEAARDYWRRAAAVNPWVAEYRRGLALLLIQDRAWAEAAAACADWVRLDPLNPEARAARVQCLLAVGDRDGARAEFARLEALAPRDLPELRTRFLRKLR